MMDNLKELYKAIVACTKCQLRENATQPVCGIGEPGSKYMLIGEAPGKEEDLKGVPFIGQAGRRLDKLVGIAKISPNDCYLTNVCRCRPPGNRDPRKGEIKACKPWLLEEIRLVKPEYLIVLGAVPLSLFSSQGVKQLHGCSFEYELEDEV